MIRRFSLGLLVIFAALSGCGYTTGSLLPPQYKTLYVEPFGNKIDFVNENVRALYVPLMEVKVRSAVIDRFQLDGHLRLHDSEQSDLVLKGDLIGFERDDLRTDDNQNVQEYRLRVTVSLTMLDNTTGKTFWKETIAGESTYFTSGPQAKSETAALDETMTDLSRRIVERTIENW
ncbi:MAG: hypothetical protein HQL15_03605 [Candidatus Omnitrophica bacterium]|nr:hypothetical protein [Candidatus Omnitrophota bacterium]